MGRTGTSSSLTLGPENREPEGVVIPVVRPGQGTHSVQGPETGGTGVETPDFKPLPRKHSFFPRGPSIPPEFGNRV